MLQPATTTSPARSRRACSAPAATTFRYKKVDIRQDPLSHHLIINIFRGTEAGERPGLGRLLVRRRDRKAGQPCDPLDLGFCGDGGECATKPDPKAIACIGFGPQNSVNTLTSGGFVFAQETAAEFRFPDGVYNEIPVKGVILWNSHAFNLTHQTGRMEAWVNIYFPKPDEQEYQEQQIFNASKIFWSTRSSPLPAAVDTGLRRIVRSATCTSSDGRPSRSVGSLVGRNQTVHLFELSGHMHEHGKRFRIFRGSFTCKAGQQAGQPCSPFNPEMCPGGACTDDGGRDPQASLLYTNYVYNDPVVLRSDPPILISGSAPIADRSLTYCAHYDNGAPPNTRLGEAALDLRRRRAPSNGLLTIGGPCAASKTRCIGGPHHNELCNGNNAACDSAAGAGDGDCDACPLTGGMRTTDEMFILFGNLLARVIGCWLLV